MSKQLDDLAFQFFKLFAQYEYALKAMGYATAGRNGQAEPDWDRFANQVGAPIMDVLDQDLAVARQYILEFPPKRQIWVNNEVQWEEVPNLERSPQILFSHIRRVRNNLYHGGKFNGSWINPDRSRELIGKSLHILKALVPLDTRLSEAIHGNKA
jgi:hypothetical protein